LDHQVQADSERASNAEHDSARAPTEALDAGSTPRRILVADDLDLNRKLIADMLALHGYVVDGAADGAAAVAAIQASPYDLIFMDVVMPRVDGLAATRAIRALSSPACDVPIVALTADSFPDQLKACLGAGMDATLIKPMSMDALVSAARQWTGSRAKAAKADGQYSPPVPDPTT
jgi:two-component system, sensor histidine kinase